MKIIKIYIILGLLTAGLLTACSGDDLIMGEQSKADVISLSLDVSETGWHGETVSVSTRVGETMESLRDNTTTPRTGYGHGFGLYCNELNYENTQVTWDDTNSKWKIGTNDNKTYWKRNETGTLNVYAYAPYKTGGYTVENGILTFVAEKHSYKYVNQGNVEADYTHLLSGGNVDLLHASTTHERTNSNQAILNFRHRLAKLTFGTLTNHTGETIQLNGFTIRGTLYSQAKMNLATGVWSDYVQWTHNEETEAKINLPPDFVYVVHSEPEMAGAAPAGYAAKALIEPLPDGQTIAPNMNNNSVLLIPGTNDEIEVMVDVKNSTGEAFSFPITLEAGKEKVVNITIGTNFEVIIE